MFSWTKRCIHACIAVLYFKAVYVLAKIFNYFSGLSCRHLYLIACYGNIM